MDTPAHTHAHTSVFVLEQYMSCSTSRAPSLSSACCTVTTLSSCNSTTRGVGEWAVICVACTHYTLFTKCDAVLQQWTNPAIQNSRTGTGSTGRSPIAARFTHTNMDAVHAFSEQLNMLGLDLVASFTLPSPSHLPPITLPSPAPGGHPMPAGPYLYVQRKSKEGLDCR